VSSAPARSPKAWKERALDLVLKVVQDKGVVAAGGTQRTDSTQVIAAVRDPNRVELAGVGRGKRYGRAWRRSLSRHQTRPAEAIDVAARGQSRPGGKRDTTAGGFLAAADR
jgi:hypothetical protein